MRKKIAILGSTGSIGRQTLEVVDEFPEQFQVVALAAGSNVDLLTEQARRYSPVLVAIMDESKASELARNLAGLNIDVVTGLNGISAAATNRQAETVVTAVSGCTGLVPTLNAIRAGKNIALANKETLVSAGALVTAEAKKHGVSILPVDSEHSAIFQCLERENRAVSRLIITASGGPFRGRSNNELQKVTKTEALQHPNWAMGDKITIDSATMMNKGLEVIEAHWLFGVDWEQISVLVHPQSIIHSMVEYKDGSVLAHLGRPDMRIPIQYALSYPDRAGNTFPKLDLAGKTLSFEEPDLETFPALALAFAAGRRGGTLPAVMNAANEAAVNLFLQEKVSFPEITRLVDQVMSRHTVVDAPNLEQILAADVWAREETLRLGHARKA